MAFVTLLSSGEVVSIARSGVRTDERSEDRPKAHLSERANFSKLNQAVSVLGASCFFFSSTSAGH